MKDEWYIFGPDGSIAIEVASSEYEAIQRARRRPNFAEGELRAQYKGRKPAAPMRSGQAAKWTRQFLNDHQDWKREE